MASKNLQYKKIKDYEDLLWGLDSPVTVEKMRLCFDTIYGVNVLQITFRNVTTVPMYGLSISVALKDDSGKRIRSDIDFNYYAMEALSGKTFGASEDIIVEPEATNFDITVKGADLAEGRRAYAKIQLEKMPPAPPLSIYADLEEKFVEAYQKTFPRAKLISAPELKNDYWRCGCGHIWPLDNPKCPLCKIKKDVVFEVLPGVKQAEKERLAEEARIAEEERKRKEEEERIKEQERLEREAKEREEAERLAEEERLRKEEEERQRKEAEEAALKKKKKIITISSIAAGIVAAACLVFFVLIPNMEAKKAAELEQIAQLEAEAKASEAAILAAQLEAENAAKNAPKPLLIMPEGLDKKDKKTIWRLFGTNEKTVSKLDGFEMIEVSSEKTHTFIDWQLDPENVEISVCSGILILPNEAGGINIKMYNIDFYSEDDFKSLIEKLGYTNADVVVAACQRSSGSTAMLGLMLKQAQQSDLSKEIIGIATAKKSMNIRSGASISSPRYTTVKVGTQFDVVEALDNGWYKIIWPSSELGYAFTCNYANEYYDFEAN